MVTSAEFPSASGLGKCIGCPSSLRYQRPAEHLVSSSGCYCWLSMYLCATFVLRNNKASEGGVPSKSELESQLAMTLEEGTRGGADSNHIGMAVSMTQNQYRGVRRACSTKQRHWRSILPSCWPTRSRHFICIDALTDTLQDALTKPVLR